MDRIFLQVRGKVDILFFYHIMGGENMKKRTKENILMFLWAIVSIALLFQCRFVGVEIYKVVEYSGYPLERLYTSMFLVLGVLIIFEIVFANISIDILRRRAREETKNIVTRE